MIVRYIVVVFFIVDKSELFHNVQKFQASQIYGNKKRLGLSLLFWHGRPSVAYPRTSRTESEIPLIGRFARSIKGVLS